MRVVVIGGTGHVGTYLVPRLVARGHEVVVFSRGQRGPYQPHAAWKGVRLVTGDRLAEEQAGSFGARVRTLQPDAVIDLICFEVASAQQIVEALRGQVQHFLHCGTIWVHGPSVEVPTSEDQPLVIRGHEGMRRYLDEFWAAWEGVRMDALEVFRIDDRRFVVDVRLWGKGRRSGAEVDQLLEGAERLGARHPQHVGVAARVVLRPQRHCGSFRRAHTEKKPGK